MNSPIIFSSQQLTILNTLYQKYIDGYFAAATVVPQVVKTEIINAAVATLFSAPATVAAAPGSGKYNQFVSCIVTFDNASGDDYDTNMQLALVDAAGGVIAISRTDFLGGTAATYSQYLIPQQAAAQTADQAVENSAFKLICVGANPNPNGSPDVTLTVRLIYNIISA